MRSIIFIFAFLLFAANWVKGQTDINYNNLIPENIYQEDNDLNSEEINDLLTRYQQNPININTADEKLLSDLPFLSSYQIKSFLEYKKLHGDIRSIYQLKLIDTWDMNTIRLIKPLIKVENNNPSYKKEKSKHTLIYRMKYLPDTILNNYEGSPFQMLTKYQADYGKIFQLGITAEKDPGESSFTTHNKTFDFVSSSIFIKPKRIVKNIAIGDYHAKFGQGLLLWTGFGMGKSSFLSAITKKENGFSRYSGIDENRIMRGVATTIGLKDVDFSLFYSRKKIDASMNEEDSLNGEKSFSAIQTTGLHRTAREIETENALTLQQYGSNVSLNKSFYHIGLTALHTDFNAIYDPVKTLNNYHRFRGKENDLFSFDYRLLHNKSEWFGEAAMMNAKEYAIIQGISCHFIPSMSGIFVYRNYSPGYFSLYNSSFGEHRDAVNENGFFTGLEARPGYGWTLTAYADVFQFPWLRYNASSPSDGRDYLFEISHMTSDKFNWSARIKHKQVSENDNSTELAIPLLTRESKMSEKFTMSYTISNSWELRNRIEICQYHKNSIHESGYLISQDIIWHNQKNNLRLYLRYAVFETNSYNARIYVYENDLPLAFSMPFYYGKGSRTCLMMEFRPIKKIRCGIRCGNKQIFENTKSNMSYDISGQIMLVI